MHLIEYVITQGRAEPSVVYRSGVSARTPDAAGQVAHGTLELVRRMFPTTPPSGFQIFDDNDEIVLRSWETIPLRLSGFGVSEHNTAVTSGLYAHVFETDTAAAEASDAARR